MTNTIIRSRLVSHLRAHISQLLYQWGQMIMACHCGHLKYQRGHSMIKGGLIRHLLLVRVANHPV